MRLYIAFIPILIFMAFGYGVSVLDRATDGAKVELTGAAAKVVVKSDVQNVAKVLHKGAK